MTQADMLLSILRLHKARPHSTAENETWMLKGRNSVEAGNVLRATSVKD
jgi:hypothetical protein